MAKRVGFIGTIVAAAAIAVASGIAFKDKLVDLRPLAQADAGRFNDIVTVSDAVQKDLSDIKKDVDKIPKAWSALNISKIGQAESDINGLKDKLNNAKSRIIDLRVRIGLILDGSASSRILSSELKKLESAFADLDAQVKTAEATISRAKDLRDNPKKAAEEMSKLLAR